MIDGTHTKALAEFRARVSECRERLDRLEEAAPPQRAECLRTALEAASRALRSGSHAGFEGFDRYARTLTEVFSAFSDAAGTAAPRLRQLLIRTVRLLEQAAQGAHPHACEMEASWLRAEVAPAALDLAWADHTSDLWIERRGADADAE